MDIEEIQSNLHSLRQLYGLLKKDEDGLPNVTSETLDYKARLLLKSLLDSASERVLKAHSQIVAGQFEPSFQNASAQPQQLKDSAKEQLLELPNLFNQRWEKQSGGTQTILKPTTEVGVIETPNLIFSATESENTRKRCRVCQRPKTIKQFKPIGKDHGRPNSIRVTTLQDKPSNQSSHFCFASGSNERENENGVFLNCVSSGIGSMAAASSNRPEFDRVETEEIPEEDKNCLSKEVADAIKQIERHISSLQLEAKSGKNINESPIFSANQATTTPEQIRYFSSPIAQQRIRNAGPVAKHNMSSRAEEPNGENEILKGNWLALQDIKAILNKLESGHEPNSSEHDFANHITSDYKDYSILKGQKKTVNAHPALSAINQDQDLVPRITRTTRKSTKEREKDLQHHRTLRQTYLDSKHGQLTEARKNLYKSVKDLKHFGLSRKDNYPKRRYLQQEQEAIASSSYSSQSSEQQRSTYDSHTEDYSESASYIIGSSSGENEVYTSSLPDSASFPHSGESEASSQAISYSNDYSSKTSSPGRVYKSANEKTTEKQDGRWRKLKDKLGIIFHHHHHHHHHNNNKKDENTSTKVNHETPLPKRKGKSPNNPPRKHEGHEELQGGQKVSKSVVRDQQRGKSQHGSQFHALVQGLKHTRHLKKSKSMKHGSLPSKNGKHGNKKAVKTSHWWQMLRHHGRLNKPPPLLESSVRNKHT